MTVDILTTIQEAEIQSPTGRVPDLLLMPQHGFAIGDD